MTGEFYITTQSSDSALYFLFNFSKIPLAAFGSRSPLRKGIFKRPPQSLRDSSPNNAEGILGAHLQIRRPALGIAGGSDCAAKDDDQQDVGSACERQDGKRVVKGSLVILRRSPQSRYCSPAPTAQRSTSHPSHPSNPPLSLYTSLHNLLIIIYKNFKIKVND